MEAYLQKAVTSDAEKRSHQNMPQIAVSQKNLLKVTEDASQVQETLILKSPTVICNLLYKVYC